MKKTLLLAAILSTTASVMAEDSAGIQLSLTPDIALQPSTTLIRGLSLNIWGENPQNGLTLGFVNGSTGESSGLTWGLVNYAESYSGVAWGVVNVSKTSFTGWQSGTVNYSTGTFTGLQSGFVNYAESLQGVQIGFLNIVKDNPWFDEFPNKLAMAFPFVNWSF